MVPAMADRPDNDTHFGFRTVPAAAKAVLVREVFDSVARQYDLMNDLMSGGIHRLWKRAMVDWLAPRGAVQVLDVAGGTGDIAFRIRERAPESRVIVADINAQMLSVGRDRSVDRGLLHGLDWVCVNAERLPFPDRSMDAYTIAFGIRNVTDIAAALREARRVLKPGGRFLCLEFSRLRHSLLDPVYDAYSFQVLPQLGELVTGNGDAYRYLAESIRRFPDQEVFARMIAAAGLGQIRMRDLSGGIAALHSAWRL